MKKIDKLILSAFLGPFILTFLVVVFIMLMQHMLKYFDDIIGKDLGFDVIGALMFYFGIVMTPVATPLAVLLSSLITFGTLGEHFELTAIKSAGISLLRAVRPIFVFVLILTALAFYVNNNLVPKAALEAYSLLYDIKQKKPALDLREGIFYSGIPGISIKVDKKFKDEAALKDVIVYDHRKRNGNTDVTIADSGRMYTIMNEQYLKFELYNGYSYSEGQSGIGSPTVRATKGNQKINRIEFDKAEFVFDLSSFRLSRTDKQLFQGNRIMRNISQLGSDIDSIGTNMLAERVSLFANRTGMFRIKFIGESMTLPPELEEFREWRDSISNAVRDLRMEAAGDSGKERTIPKPVNFLSTHPGFTKKIYRSNEIAPLSVALHSDSIPAPNDSVERVMDSIYALPINFPDVQTRVREAKTRIDENVTRMLAIDEELKTFRIQWHLIITNSLACVAMFLIGAPLGAIIKRGGLGVPFLVSILFFIIFYLINMFGQKWAKQDLVSVPFGVWLADIILVIIGILFMRQARVDARLFDADFYRVFWDKVKNRFFAGKKAKAAVSV